MANRIAGNTIIVDSAMGNAFILTSANMPVHLGKLHVNQVAFWSSDTTGLMQISETDTSSIICKLGWMANGTGTSLQAATLATSFGKEQCWEFLKIPTLTAGTAWIYLC